MLINNIRKSPTCPIRNTIHAPTRGATIKSLRLMLPRFNFNPRSYKRSDIRSTTIFQKKPVFQSTLLQEERLPEDHILMGAAKFQSTLLQEERLKYLFYFIFNGYFNPRSYKRSDFPGTFHGAGRKEFQSTLLQEERRCSRNMEHYMRIFQSTLLQEERHVIPKLWKEIKRISIHAPTRGATAWMYLPECYREISIHAPTRGATHPSRQVPGR